MEKLRPILDNKEKKIKKFLLGLGFLFWIIVIGAIVYFIKSLF